MRLGRGKERLPPHLFLLLGRTGFRPDPPEVANEEEERHDDVDGDVAVADPEGDVVGNTDRLETACDVALRVVGAAIEQLLGEAGPLLILHRAPFGT